MNVGKPGTLNVALIGHRFMGKAHTHAFTDVNIFFEPKLRPVKKVLCARSPDVPETAARWGWEETESDWRRVVSRPDVDLVDVTAPSLIHKDIVLAAAANGKHVFCEKPLAMTLSDAREMVNAVEDAGVVNMIGFNYRAVPALALCPPIGSGRRTRTHLPFQGLLLTRLAGRPEFPVSLAIAQEGCRGRCVLGPGSPHRRSGPFPGRRNRRTDRFAEHVHRGKAGRRVRGGPHGGCRRGKGKGGCR